MILYITIYVLGCIANWIFFGWINDSQDECDKVIFPMVLLSWTAVVSILFFSFVMGISVETNKRTKFFNKPSIKNSWFGKRYRVYVTHRERGKTLGKDLGIFGDEDEA